MFRQLQTDVDPYTHVTLTIYTITSQKLTLLLNLPISVIDSWGKLEPGFFQGNIRWLGDFDECMNITVSTNGSLPEDFNTRYCSTAIPTPVSIINLCDCDTVIIIRHSDLHSCLLISEYMKYCSFLVDSFCMSSGVSKLY